MGIPNRSGFSKHKSVLINSSFESMRIENKFFSVFFPFRIWIWPVNNGAVRTILEERWKLLFLGASTVTQQTVSIVRDCFYHLVEKKKGIRDFQLVQPFPKCYFKSKREDWALQNRRFWSIKRFFFASLSSSVNFFLTIHTQCGRNSYIDFMHNVKKEYLKKKTAWSMSIRGS